MPQVPVNIKPQGSLLERITQVREALDDTVRKAKFMGGQVQLDISFAQTLLLFMQEVVEEIEEMKEVVNPQLAEEIDPVNCGG